MTTQRKLSALSISILRQSLAQTDAALTEYRNQIARINSDAELSVQQLENLNYAKDRVIELSKQREKDYNALNAAR